MADNTLPNFRRLYQSSDVFTTLADAEAPALEPWIQWYSIHTGLPYSSHGVFRLNDGPKRKDADLWTIAHQRGFRTINFSSMNARRYEAPNSVYLADPWCTSESPYPPELKVFYDFVSYSVQEYTNSSKKFGMRQYMELVNFLITHGIRPRTFYSIAKQLAAEKTAVDKPYWKRVAILDMLMVDVFLYYFRKTKPKLATLFLNSTAHLQHSYWLYMEPEAFERSPDRADMACYKEAILFGYRSMDEIVGRVMKAMGKDDIIVMATALSQQPFLKYEASGGQHFFRLIEPERFLALLDLPDCKVQPVMTHQYFVTFRSSAERDAAVERLRGMVMGEDRLFDVAVEGDRGAFFGCQLRKLINGDPCFVVSEGDRVLRFFEWFYQLDVVKSGCHHPEGALWFRTGMHRVHEEKVSILDILPTVLACLGIAQPSTADLPGRRLPLERVAMVAEAKKVRAA
jgi:hypothetical protein